MRIFSADWKSRLLGAVVSRGPSSGDATSGSQPPGGSSGDDSPRSILSSVRRLGRLTAEALGPDDAEAANQARRDESARRIAEAVKTKGWAWPGEDF
jgi:hypothetical protein